MDLLGDYTLGVDPLGTIVFALMFVGFFLLCWVIDLVKTRQEKKPRRRNRDTIRLYWP